MNHYARLPQIKGQMYKRTVHLKLSIMLLLTNVTPINLTFKSK